MSHSLAAVLVFAASAAFVPDTTVTAAPAASMAWSPLDPVGQSDEVDESRAAPVDEGRSTNGITIALILLGSVFLVGLRAIKRQRDEGRRSRWPPIG